MSAICTKLCRTLLTHQKYILRFPLDYLRYGSVIAIAAELYLDSNALLKRYFELKLDSLYMQAYREAGFINTSKSMPS